MTLHMEPLNMAPHPKFYFEYDNKRPWLDKTWRPYFCKRIQQKLEELPEFEGKDLSGYQEQHGAIIQILTWADDGEESVSPQFREFYDGLLCYCAMERAASLGPEQELVNILFEIHGSNPRSFPRVVQFGFDLLKKILREDVMERIWSKRRPAPAPLGQTSTMQQIFTAQTPGLWDVFDEGISLGIPEACMLRRYLEDDITRLRNWVEELKVEEPEFPSRIAIYDRFKIGTGYLRLPLALGLFCCSTNACDSLKPGIERFCMEFRNQKRQGKGKDPTDILVSPTMDLTLSPSPSTREEGREESKSFRIFVGPSGCGKTSRMKSLLEQQWGFYLLPGNLPREIPQTAQSGDNSNSALNDRLEYMPRRSGGSRDTQTWFGDVKSMHQFGSSYWRAADSLMDLVLQIRLCIMGEFRRTGSTLPSPAAWLRLQSNCDHPRQDIFNRVYRVVRFCQDLPKGLGTVSWPERKLLFCLDEAQCDLQGNLPRVETTFDGKTSQIQDFEPLSCMLRAVAGNTTNIVGQGNWEMAFSGTALQLDETVQAINRQSPEILALSSNIFRWAQRAGRSAWGKCIPAQLDTTPPDLVPEVLRSFELVQEDEDFRQLLMSRRFDFDARYVPMIIQHSIPLRGRYVWSQCYLDEIEKLFRRKTQGNQRVLEKEVHETSARVYWIAKQGLKKRLKDMEMRPFRTTMDEYGHMLLKQSIAESQDLRDPGRDHEGIVSAFQKRQRLHEELLDELCWLAIRSDLSGEATIFKSSNAAKLVSHGFAFLRKQGSTGSRVMLIERLAVDAAIEYFQDQKLSGGQSKYDRALVNFLYLEQNNASALGKTAELFFAWHLRKVLGKPKQHQDITIPYFSGEYRADVLRLLVGNACTVQKQGTNSQFENHVDCELSELRLVEGNSTAYQEQNKENRLLTMWDWMKRIREGKTGNDLGATFWLPSNNAGPDVLFALRGPSEPVGELSRKRRRAPANVRKLDYSLILCAVQIKRTEQLSEVTKAIQTTDPNYWFHENYPTDALRMVGELREWQTGGYPIVRILVTALEDAKGYLAPEVPSQTTVEKYFSNKAAKTSVSQVTRDGRDDNLQDVRIPSHQQYYTSIGARSDSLVFGDAFGRLRKAQGIETTQERKQNKSMAELSGV